MMTFPNISPIALDLGLFQIHWYALCYIISFVFGNFFLKKVFKKQQVDISDNDYDNFIFNIMLGILVGGRLGYVLFYNLPYYLQHPLESILPFSFTGGFRFTGFTGMSFHGGALGVIIAVLIFCRQKKKNFYLLADPSMPFIAVGLGLGRIGNFINGELYGRVTDLPWGMVFPGGGALPRHPSQLYESLAEGVLMVIILVYINRLNLKKGNTFWAFIGLYGIFRFLLEFVREPDEHLGFIFAWLTQGQILSSFMIVSALVAFVLLNKSSKTVEHLKKVRE